MVNYLEIKDANSITKRVQTIEDSTSAHYNMSIPITVSGLPIFTTVAPGIVCVKGISDVSVQDNASVSIRGGRVSIADSTLAVTQSGAWAVSVSDKVSVAGRVSVDNLVAVSVNGPLPAGTNILGKVSTAGLVSVWPANTIVPDTDAKALQGFQAEHVLAANYVRNRVGGNWDMMTGTSLGILVTGSVGISGPLPAGTNHLGKVSVEGLSITGATTPQVSVGGPVSVQANQMAGTDGTNARTILTDTAGALVITSIKDDVSIAPQILTTHVCNALTITGGTQVVSIGGAVSLQAVQIAGRDTAGDARSPLMTTGGALIVHVSNTAPGGAAGSTQVVSVGGAVSTQAVQVAFSDGTDARTPLTDTTGAIVVTSIKDDVSIAPQTLITHVSNIVNVSVMDKVSVAGTVNAVQSGTWTVQPGNTANTTPWLVSVTGNVSLSDNAPVSIRGGVLGAVSLGGGSALIGGVSVRGTPDVNAIQSGTWTVQPGNTANTTPWLVSVGGNVSLSDNAPVSVRGGVLGAVSIGGGTAHIGRVSVFVDQVPFNVSVNNTLPIPVSVVGGRVSIADSTLAVTQSGTWTVQPGNTANTTPWLVSVNGQVSLAAGVDKRVIGAVSIADATLAVTQSGTWNVNTSTVGRVSVFVDQVPFNVSVNNTLPIPVSVVGGRVSIQGISQVSVAGAVTVAPLTNTGAAIPAGAFFVGGTDGTNLRGLLTTTGGALVVHVSNAQPTPPAAGATQLITIGGAVSTEAVQVAFTDGTNARTPLTDTTGAIVITSIKDDVSIAPQTLIVHVCNTAPGGGGGSPQVLIGGAVSNQAGQIAGVDGSGNARTPLTDVGGTLKVGGFTVNPEYVFTRPADTTAYTVGDLCGNSTTAGSVVPMSFPVSRLTGGGGSFMIRRARLITANDNRTADRTYRLHIFNTATGVSVAGGDNAVFSPSPVSVYAGWIDIPMILSATTGAAGIGSPGGGSDINIQLAAGQVSISTLLEVRTSILPGSAVTYRVFLEILQD